MYRKNNRRFYMENTMSVATALDNMFYEKKANIWMR